MICGKLTDDGVRAHCMLRSNASMVDCIPSRYRVWQTAASSAGWQEGRVLQHVVTSARL